MRQYQQNCIFKSDCENEVNVTAFRDASSPVTIMSLNKAKQILVLKKKNIIQVPEVIEWKET